MGLEHGRTTRGGGGVQSMGIEQGGAEGGDSGVQSMGVEHESTARVPVRESAAPSPTCDMGRAPWCGWSVTWGDVRAAVEEPSRPTAGIRQPLPQIA